MKAKITISYEEFLDGTFDLKFTGTKGMDSTKLIGILQLSVCNVANKTLLGILINRKKK